MRDFNSALDNILSSIIQVEYDDETIEQYIAAVTNILVDLYQELTSRVSQEDLPLEEGLVIQSLIDRLENNNLLIQDDESSEERVYIDSDDDYSCDYLIASADLRRHPSQYRSSRIGASSIKTQDKTPTLFENQKKFLNSLINELPSNGTISYRELRVLIKGSVKILKELDEKEKLKFLYLEKNKKIKNLKQELKGYDFGVEWDESLTCFARLFGHHERGLLIQEKNGLDGFDESMNEDLEIDEEDVEITWNGDENPDYLCTRYNALKKHRELKILLTKLKKQIKTIENENEKKLLFEKIDDVSIYTTRYLDEYIERPEKQTGLDAVRFIWRFACMFAGVVLGILAIICIAIPGAQPVGIPLGFVSLIAMWPVFDKIAEVLVNGLYYKRSPTKGQIILLAFAIPFIAINIAIMGVALSLPAIIGVVVLAKSHAAQSFLHFASNYGSVLRPAATAVHAFIIGVIVKKCCFGHKKKSTEKSSSRFSFFGSFVQRTWKRDKMDSNNHLAEESLVYDL